MKSSYKSYVPSKEIFELKCPNCKKEIDDKELYYYKKYDCLYCKKSFFVIKEVDSYS